MNDFILVHYTRSGREFLIPKKEIVSVEENEQYTVIETRRKYFGVKETPSEILRQLEG